MKLSRYIIFVLGAAMALGCDKHEIVTYLPHDNVDGKALVQIIYIEPVASNVAANKVDSVYLNDKFAGGVGGLGQLSPKGIFPYGNTFYTVPTGNLNVKFFRGKDTNGKGVVVYDKTFTVKEGMSELYVYDLDEEPLVLDHQGDFKVCSPKGTPETFNTDSVASYRFVNFVFNAEGAPYGPLQYQYANNTSNYTDGDWHNIGDPVGFGESTTRNLAIVHKTTYNSSGNQTLRFRCVDPITGEFIAKTGDYWTSYLGRAYTHVGFGKLNGSPAMSYMQIGNNY